MTTAKKTTKTVKKSTKKQPARKKAARRKDPTMGGLWLQITEVYQREGVELMGAIAHLAWMLTSLCRLNGIDVQEIIDIVPEEELPPLRKARQPRKTSRPTKRRAA